MEEDRDDDDAASSSSSCSSIINSSSSSISYDHLMSILLLLPLESILSFGMTCKKAMALTRSQTLWKSLCARDWPQSKSTSSSSSSASSSSSMEDEDWYRLYYRLHNLDRVSCFNLITLTQHQQQQEEAPSPRASHSLNFFFSTGTTAAGCLLLFGGGCQGGRHLDDTWIAYIGGGGGGNAYSNNNINYKTSSSSKMLLHWQRLVSQNAPSGRFGHSSVVIGNSLVLFGGINDTGIRQNDTWIAPIHHDYTNTTTTFSWRLLDVGPVAPPPRGAHASCSIDNRTMLIHGGISLAGTRLGDTWVLYLSENLCCGTWHQTLSHDPVPSPRSGHTLTCIGGSKTVLFGGRGMGYEVLNDVWYFDSSHGHLTWVPVLFDPRNIPGGLSLARVGHSADLISGGRVLIYGGEDSYRHRKDDFWLLDITRRRRRVWRRLKCEGYQPKSRSFHRASADDSGRYLYVFGGMVDGILQPAEPTGLRFDGELFVVELLL